MSILALRFKSIQRLKFFLIMFLRPKGKVCFIYGLPRRANLLDVGCGNNAPLKTKAQRNDIYYTGIDIGNYHQDFPVESFADKYIITNPAAFASEIGRMENMFDGVISSHNIEHCDDPEATLRSMLKALKKGGSLYLSCPCEESKEFPSRKGTLNFFDDPSHNMCPDFNAVISIIESENCHIIFVVRRYRPMLLATIGFFLEPLSWLCKRNMPLSSTWALYGFETIIWAIRD